MRTSAILLCTLVLLAAPPALAQDDAVGALVKQARQEFDAGKADAAIAKLEQARRIDPRDARPGPLLAYILFTAKDDLDRATTVLGDQLDRYPDSKYAKDLLADVASKALDTGNAALAREGWRFLRQVEPEAREPLYMWARASYRLGDLVPARQALRQLIDRFPSYRDPYWLLARIQIDEGNARKASETYRDLLIQWPGDVSARLARASVLLWNLRDYDAAETEYTSAMQLAAPGSSLLEEGKKGLDEVRRQKALAVRLRDRDSRLTWLLGSILAIYAVFLGVTTMLTKPREEVDVADEGAGRK